MFGPYAAGYSAAMTNQPASRNPHPGDTWHTREWVCGHREATRIKTLVLDPVLNVMVEPPRPASLSYA